MNYKSKANRIGVQSLALLGLRIIDTVNKSGIEDAKVSKPFVQLVEVNSRYKVAIVPGNKKQLTQNIKIKYKQRGYLFKETYGYLEGLLNSPDQEMKTAANLLFEQLNMFGKNFSKLKIADQSLRYIRIIESLKKDEFKAALAKTLLTDKVMAMDQAQLEYEDMYMGRGNSSTEKVAPSNIRKEMENAIKLYIDEVRWMATRTETEAWTTLSKNLEQRFNEVNVSVTKQKTDSNTAENTTSTDPTA